MVTSKRTIDNLIEIEKGLIELAAAEPRFFAPLADFMWAVDRVDGVPVEKFFEYGISKANLIRVVEALKPFHAGKQSSDIISAVNHARGAIAILVQKYKIKADVETYRNNATNYANDKGDNAMDTFKTVNNNSDLRGVIDTLNKKADKMSKDAVAEIKEVLEQTRNMKKSDTEYTKNMTFLRAASKLPWGKVSKDEVDIEKVEKVLNDSHFGLDEAKERITEFLAVRTLKTDSEAPKFLMIGAPGTGKTSLANAIGKAMGRQVQRVSLGGVSDSSAIKGHRRTYVGSVYGRIIDAVLKAGVDNPIIILDEMDKLVTGQGDPQGALLELLDVEQNHEFTDYYLNFPYDLSKVMFICTANYADLIDGALWDRLELIEIPGYTMKEKMTIITDYIMPQTEEKNGLEKGSVKMSAKAKKFLVEGYTREAGLRRVQQSLDKLVRKVAVLVAKGKKAPSITPKFIEKHMGERYFNPEEMLKHTFPGQAHGLYYSAVGGGCLPMEAVLTDNAGSVELTGRMQEVMQESTKIAYGYLKSHSINLGIDYENFEDYGIQIHIPDGSTPKEGPSAGLAFTLLMASVLSNRTVLDGLALTGEVTLHGHAKKIGGVYEKVTGGLRAGATTFILPEENRRDYEELPVSVKKAATFHFVKHVNEVLEIGLGLVYDEDAVAQAEMIDEDETFVIAY